MTKKPVSAPLKSTRGGHNKLMEEPKRKPLKPILVDELPWIKRPGSKTWTRRKIFSYLASRFYEQGFTSSEFAGEIVTKLSHAHHQLSMALGAIEADAVSPRLGARDAYTVASSTSNDVLRCMEKLGLYPLPKRDIHHEQVADAPKKARKSGETSDDILNPYG